MTIDEARKKLCIFDIFATENFDAYCVADKCMAWRWNCEDTSIVIGETIDGEKIRTKGERAMSATDGYCGLCGRQGAE